MFAHGSVVDEALVSPKDGAGFIQRQGSGKAVVVARADAELEWRRDAGRGVVKPGRLSEIASRGIGAERDPYHLTCVIYYTGCRSALDTSASLKLVSWAYKAYKPRALTVENP